MLWDTSKENQIVHRPITDPDTHKELVDSLQSPVTLQHLQDWDQKIAAKVQEMWKWSQDLKALEARLQSWEQKLIEKEQKLQSMPRQRYQYPSSHQSHSDSSNGHYRAPERNGYDGRNRRHSHAQKPYDSMTR